MTSNFPNYEDDDINYQNNKLDEIGNNKKQIPVKTQMKDMEDQIAELKNDLNNNMKNGQILRGENASLQARAQEKCNEITKCIMDDLYNFEKDFSRIKQNDKTETAFIEQQIKSLQQDSIKLKTQVIQLDSRLKTCETDVGVELK
jgi:hypothetical protein